MQRRVASATLRVCTFTLIRDPSVFLAFTESAERLLLAEPHSAERLRAELIPQRIVDLTERVDNTGPQRLQNQIQRSLCHSMAGCRFITAPERHERTWQAPPPRYSHQRRVASRENCPETATLSACRSWGSNVGQTHLPPPGRARNAALDRLSRK